MQALLREWLSDVHAGQSGRYVGVVALSSGDAKLEFDSDNLDLRVNGQRVGVDPSDVDELSSPAIPLAAAPLAAANRPLAKYFIHVNNVCNLRCSYCYQQDLPYDKISHDVLSLENLEEACSFVTQSSGQNDIQLTYFGGEPFLSFDRVVAFQRRLEEMLPGRNIIPNIVTNGTLIKDGQTGFLIEKGFHVMVSFDGKQENQDRQRPGPNGTASYQRALGGIRTLLAAGVKKVSVRITYGQNSLDLVENIRHVAELGVHDISYRPIMDVTAVDQWPDEDAHFDALRGVVDLYLERLIAGSPTLVNNVHELVRRIVQREPKRDYCGWAKTCSITPDGDLYPCTHFVGIPEFKLGSIKSGIDEAKRRQLLDAARVENLPCRDCNIRSLCGGGCRGSSHYAHGDVFREDDYCEARREQVHAVLLGIAELSLKGTWQQNQGRIQALMGRGTQKHSCDRFS